MTPFFYLYFSNVIGFVVEASDFLKVPLVLRAAVAASVGSGASGQLHRFNPGPHPRALKYVTKIFWAKFPPRMAG